MSSYKIYARKGRKVMPIKVEEKHLYTHMSATADVPLSMYKPNTTLAEDSVKGYSVNTATVELIHNSNMTSIQQGTAENQRIGNKVNIKSICITFDLYINPTVLLNTYSHGQLMDTWFNFRIMTVKFKQQMSTTDIARWYRQSHIYYRTANTGGAVSYPVQSNWMDKLRESSPWTGSFEILYDKKFTVNKVKSAIQMNIKVPFNGQVNFDNTSNRPTSDQGFSNIYTFLISPSNTWLDMDPVSTDKTVTLGTDSTILFYCNANVKTIYYDM